MASSVTFVTSFFYIYEHEYDPRKTVPWRIERFREIASTGIKICVYVCPTMEPHVKALEAEFPDNVKYMKTLEIGDTVIANMLRQHGNYTLPDKRSDTKDVPGYLTVINSKTEFMTHAVDVNPWGSTHFAWIDFNISHVFFDKERSLEFLRFLGTRTWFEPSFFVIPGCWDKWSGEHIGHVSDTIHWRFCGGFFMGDSASIRRFHALYLEFFPQFLSETRKLVWEVNFWAWLEAKTEWLSVYEPDHGHKAWYKADHNDSIIGNVWARVFSKRVLDFSGNTTCVYDYPKIEGYNASSAAYLYHGGKHWLNTRYVNYWYYPDGWYMFYDGVRIIRSKNILSELVYSEDRGGFVPVNFREINETVNLPSYEMYSRGIEDVRLYAVRDQMKYIATTVGYHSTGGNRMIMGNFNVDQLDLTGSTLIEPPTDTFLEKNWVPVVLNNPTSEFHGRELFIYSWGPFRVGQLRYDTGSSSPQLEIIYSEESTRLAPFFHRMKGSALLVDRGDVLVGVVHFSEELRPRHYFHVMVELDRRTLRPLRYSEPFYFEAVSIEFCIGFTLTPETDRYVFWISRMDRDPLMVVVPVSDLPCTEHF